MGIAKNITAKTTKRSQFGLKFQPQLLINHLVHPSDGLFIDDLATKNERHSI
jgi:hypothetical protein